MATMTHDVGRGGCEPDYRGGAPSLRKMGRARSGRAPPSDGEIVTGRSGAVADENQRGDLAMQQRTEHERDQEGDDDAMSPAIRELILSFGQMDPDQQWDPDAFTKRPLRQPKLAPV